MHDQLAFLAAFFLLGFVYSVFLILEGMQNGRRAPPDERVEGPPASGPDPRS